MMNVRSAERIRMAVEVAEKWSVPLETAWAVVDYVIEELGRDGDGMGAVNAAIRAVVKANQTSTVTL